MNKHQTLWQRWWDAFKMPTYALPIDFFRVATGSLSFLFFIGLIHEVADISSPDGLIDHVLLQRILWFTRWSLFHPGLTASHFYFLFGMGLITSVLIVIGWHPKWAAFYCYLMVVSAYRWNFMVSYLDDGLMHIALLWVILMPSGQTLVLSEWRRDGWRAWERWKHVQVPGAAVHAFLGNLALIYLVAGLWKWQSPMWLDGSALYAGLKLPISRAPDFWQPHHLPLVMVMNYVSLVLEPVLALLVFLPRSHPLKWLLVAGSFALHGGIILTLRIPFANALCLAGLFLVLRHEIMAWLRAPLISPVTHEPSRTLRLPERLAVTLIVMLLLVMLADTLPWWSKATTLSRQPAPNGLTYAPGQVQEILRSQAKMDTTWDRFTANGNPLYGPLWLVGVGQRYQLFNWIDDVNYTARYEITEGTSIFTNHAADQRLFPQSLRGTLLQSYLNDVRWTLIPSPWPNTFKQRLFERFAKRYCRLHQPAQPVDVHVTVERITMQNLELNQGTRERLMAFECGPDAPRMVYMRLSPESVP